jgi:hypothetical protein
MAGGSRQVFISYARRDAQRVDRLADGLRQLRYDIWMDKELTGGERWWDAILSHIRASSAVLVAVSLGALESVAVRREYEYGYAIGLPLLPVVVDTVPHETLPPLLAPLHLVDYREADTQSAFALAAALANLPAPATLPHPLPEPPPIPISYVSGLRERSRATLLSLEEQLVLVAQLKVALRREGERDAAAEVLRSLQTRDDLYQVSAQEIDALLSPTRRASSPGGRGVNRTAETPDTVRHDRALAARLIADAEDIAYSAPEYVQPAVLAAFAEGLAATDPDRAERIARSVESRCSGALADVARRLAATDPDRAERIADTIPHEWGNDRARADIAAAMAGTDPARAERIAEALTDDGLKVRAVTRVAQALAVTDPDRAARLLAEAEQTAHVITHKTEKTTALADLAAALAVPDPARALRMAHSIPDRFVRSGALVGVARTLAATDPDRAEGIAQSMTDKFVRAWALAEVAKALTISAPDRAARLIADAEGLAFSAEGFLGRLTGSEKSRARASIAQALAATDINRAERVAQSIDEPEKTWALLCIARARAATDPDGAERVAQSITRDGPKESALVEIAKTLATTDPDRAERIANAMPDEVSRVRALMRIATG